MDEKSVRILKAIAEEGTRSPEQIHRKTGIPPSTIHYRLDQLREAGVVENDLFDLDLGQLGFGLTVVTEVWAEFAEDYHHAVGEKLADVEGVNQVYFTMGDEDFVVVANLTSRTMVQRLIEDFEAIDGVVRTSSKFVVTTVKDEPNAMNGYDLASLVDVLAPGGEP